MQTKPDYCTFDENDEFCCDGCTHAGKATCPEYVNDNDSWSTDAGHCQVND